MPWLAAIQAWPLDGRSLAELGGVKAEKVLSDLAHEILTLLEKAANPNPPAARIVPPTPVQAKAPALAAPSLAHGTTHQRANSAGSGNVTIQIAGDGTAVSLGRDLPAPSAGTQMKKRRARSSKAKPGRMHRSTGTVAVRQLAHTRGSQNRTIRVQGNTFVFSVPPYLAHTPSHQLRPPPADFTGRGAEVETLRSALTAAGAGQAILGIFGAGGTGKTALAAQLCEEIAPRYPDAQVYLDLQGLSTPLTAGEAMRWVVRSLETDVTPPAGERELAARFRETLHGQRVLLFMDNAAAPDQVEALAPGAGSLLLITAQPMFSLPGLVAVRLGALEEPEARRFLLRICPRIGEVAAALAAACGRLPLALRVAGSALANQADLAPAAYARRLAEGQESLGPVDASLEASGQCLLDELRRLWQLLGVFPRTFTAKAVAFVWQVDKAAAESALGKLVVRNLVDYAPSSGRYGLHDLARAFASRRVGAADRAMAEHRHAVFYLAVLQFAATVYASGRAGDDLVALRVFDAEWENIRAGQRWSVSHSTDDRAATEMCSGYASWSPHFLFLRVDVQERIRWDEAALAAAKRTGDRAAETIHLGQLGTDHREALDTGAAIKSYQEQLVLARALGDPERECSALGNLGSAYKDLLGDPERALELFNQALQIARHEGLRPTEGIVLHNIGLVHLERGELAEARAFLEQDLAIAREGGISSHIGHSLASLAEVKRQMGDTTAATEDFEKALSLAQAAGDHRSQSTVLVGLGTIARGRGERERAVERFEEAAAVARQRAALGHESWAKWNLGLLYDEAGDFARAAELMQMRVDLERRIGHANAEKDAALILSIRTKVAPAEPG